MSANVYLVYRNSEVIDVVVADFAVVASKYPDKDVQVWRDGVLKGSFLGKDLLQPLLKQWAQAATREEYPD